LILSGLLRITFQPLEGVRKDLLKALNITSIATATLQFNPLQQSQRVIHEIYMELSPIIENTIIIAPDLNILMQRALAMGLLRLLLPPM
jgi:hypothetical protein